MSRKVLEIYDFKVVEGCETRARICYCINSKWMAFVRNLDSYEKMSEDWEIMSETLYNQLNLMRIYTSFLEEIGLIRPKKADEFYSVLDEHQKRIIAVQVEKCVGKE